MADIYLERGWDCSRIERVCKGHDVVLYFSPIWQHTNMNVDLAGELKHEVARNGM